MHRSSIYEGVVCVESKNEGKCDVKIQFSKSEYRELIKLNIGFSKIIFIL